MSIERANTPAESQASRSERPKNVPPKDWQFKKGNAGKKKGTKDKRTILGQEAARALEAGAWDVVERLLASPSWRARHEAAKTVLSYAIGLPRQTLMLEGGFGDLSRELAAALVEARARRAALDASQPVAALSVAPEALPALPAAAVFVSSVKDSLTVPAPTTIQAPATAEALTRENISYPKSEAPS